MNSTSTTERDPSGQAEVGLSDHDELPEEARGSSSLPVYPRRHKLSIPHHPTLQKWSWCLLEDTIECLANHAEIFHGIRPEFFAKSSPLDFLCRFFYLCSIYEGANKNPQLNPILTIVGISKNAASAGNGTTIFGIEDKDLTKMSSTSRSVLTENNVYLPEGWVQLVKKAIEKGVDRVFYAPMFISANYPTINRWICGVRDGKDNTLIQLHNL